MDETEITGLNGADQQRTLGKLRQALNRIENGEGRPDGSLFGETGFAGGTAAEDASFVEGSEKAAGGSEGSEYEKARAVVLRKLTGSPKTRHQLAEALRDREFGEQSITEVLDRMEEVGLLNDLEFARTWVRYRHELKSLGRSALRQELRERGVAQEHIEPALEQLSSEDEDAAARSMVEKKLKGRSVPSPETSEGRTELEKLTRRLVAMLARRGHSPGGAFQIVRDVIQERTTT